MNKCSVILLVRFDRLSIFPRLAEMSIFLNKNAALLIRHLRVKTYIENLKQRPTSRWRNN